MYFLNSFLFFKSLIISLLLFSLEVIFIRKQYKDSGVLSAFIIRDSFSEGQF